MLKRALRPIAQRAVSEQHRVHQPFPAITPGAVTGDVVYVTFRLRLSRSHIREAREELPVIDIGNSLAINPNALKPLGSFHAHPETASEPAAVLPVFVIEYTTKRAAIGRDDLAIPP